MANDEKNGIANATDTDHSEKAAPSKGSVLRRGVRSFRPKKQPEKAAPAPSSVAAPLPDSVTDLSQIEVIALPNKNANTASGGGDAAPAKPKTTRSRGGALKGSGQKSAAQKKTAVNTAAKEEVKSSEAAESRPASRRRSGSSAKAQAESLSDSQGGQKGAQTPSRPSANRGKGAGRTGGQSKRTGTTASAAAHLTMTPAAQLAEQEKLQTGSRKKTASRAARKPAVRIIPLGGLNEIGKNITLYECNGDMFLVDCGLSFPDDEMLGVDMVIPDFTYLERNRDKIQGLVLTHGHEDHIGGIPYLLKLMNIPVYGTRLTLGLVEGKLKEHGLLSTAKLNVVAPGDVVKFGCMSVEFINVNHSIPDACAMAIHTPAGVIIQTGDFKIDYTPIESKVINLARFGELGSKGVLALLSDSTNAERPGSTPSERKVGESFETLFANAKNRRIIIATFASNIHRIQQIVDCAVRTGRKVAISGRSMVNVVSKALELGYIHIPDGVLIDIDAIGKYSDERLVICTTGSQGEPMSALFRMAMSDHRKVSVGSNDFIIISATPIPGNEKTVSRVVNELMRLGAEVIYEKMYEVHVSGHACQDELKQMIALTRPKFFIPVHGEYKHRKKHAGLALGMGIPEENIMISDIGQVIELDGVEMKITGQVPAGAVLVDGLGVGDVGSVVLRDRKHLAEDGLIVVVIAIDSVSGKIIVGPDIVSRGFVYVREAEDMMNEAKRIAYRAVEECTVNGMKEWGNIKNHTRDALSEFFFSRTKRSPMILPVIQEI